MDAAKQREFSDALKEWYWKHGVKRGGDYALPLGEWVNQLYSANKRLRAVEAAMGKPRPSFAVWGSSQTGKSTLVSHYIDENTPYTGDPGEDGKGALYWEGGEPAYFVAPYVGDGKHPPADLNVLNPFNNRQDASSCLSRFVLGSLEKRENRFHVRDPKHPVEIKLVPQADLLHVVARGYDSECLGPKRAGSRSRRHVEWTWGQINAELTEFREENPVRDPKPGREAFEALHDFCNVLHDLSFAEVPGFAKLAEEGERAMRNQLAKLQADKVLNTSAKLVDAFAARILWDGYEPLTKRYQRMKAAHAKYRKAWGDKPVCVSIRAAALLLDMDACGTVFRERPTGKPDSRENLIHNLVPQLAFDVRGDHVVVGCSGELPNRIVNSAEEFAIFQGLVWEMDIPLNPDKLSDSPFKAYLEKADLLDFPGVGNEKKEEATSIELEPEESFLDEDDFDEHDAPPVRGEPFRPELFYTNIIKRGKTAAIVGTFAKRLVIDGFNIFQNLDGFPSANAKQLVTGINTWWKHAASSYYRDQEGPSPLPLNLALTWWAPVINEASTSSSVLLGSKRNVWTALGKISDPEVSTAFALNYHSEVFVRGRFLRKFEVGGEAYSIITEEPAFKNLFNDDVSRRSFDAMIEDKVTGGRDYFFQQLLRQVESISGSQRDAILEQRRNEAAEDLAGLLRAHRVFPPPVMRDARVEDLKRFRQSLEAAVEGRDNNQMQVLNHSLRELLDVDFNVLEEIPRDPDGIDEDFVLAEFRAWSAAQEAWYQELQQHRDKHDPDWTILGIDSRNFCHDLYQALTKSILEYTYEAEGEGRERSESGHLALWLRRLSENRNSNEISLSRSDLRRHLAQRMSLALVSSMIDDDYEEEDETGLGLADEMRDGGDELQSEVGTNCFYYKVFIRPFLEEQLPRLIRLNLDPEARPDDIPGEEELVQLCESYGIDPLADDELEDGTTGDEQEEPARV